MEAQSCARQQIINGNFNHRGFNEMTISMINKIVAAGALAVCVVGPVSAGKPGPVETATCVARGMAASCDVELGTLCAAIEATKSMRNRTRESMVSKVNGATLKINQGKPGEASTKLDNIEDSLTANFTAAKPKVSDIDYDAISGALTPAQSCVDALL
jgi:hypothetical protein